MQSSRRRFLELLCAAPALAARAPKPAGLIVRSNNPEDFEMTLDGFGTWITPVERFFVRSHLYTPTVDLAAWRLRVTGRVRRELTLDMAALRRFPRVEAVNVLECAGNGRAFYEPHVAGLQWRYGAVGNARWAGVRLADVLKQAGLQAGAREIVFNGADVPLGTMPDFVRGIPLEKAMHPDTLLAWEMNGAPLTPSHGFPLRVVPPGWAGDSWVKWVTEIQVLDREYDGFFMKTAYRRPVRPVEPGAAVDPADMTPVTKLAPKSIIATPVNGERVPAGSVTIRGAAWAGESPVAKVDVSPDNGRTWKPAELGGDRSPYGWRLWHATWTPPSRGSFVLMARATDARGEAQPFAADWNPSGYQWNVVQQVRVEAGAGAPGKPAAPPEQAAPAFPAKARVACIGCHGEEMITGQRLTRAQWEREVDKMVRWGAAVKPEDRPALVDFLVQHFGAR